MESIKSVLMRRDGLTDHEADEAIAECRADFLERLAEGDMPCDICEEYFGLEPDYIEEFLC